MGQQKPPRAMRVVSRSYRDGNSKPHIRHDEIEGTFKVDIQCEADIPKVVQDFETWCYDSFSVWEELEEEGEDE